MARNARNAMSASGAVCLQDFDVGPLSGYIANYCYIALTEVPRKCVDAHTYRSLFIDGPIHISIYSLHLCVCAVWFRLLLQNPSILPSESKPASVMLLMNGAVYMYVCTYIYIQTRRHLNKGEGKVG